MPSVFRLIKYFAIIISILFVIQVVRCTLSGEAYLPEGYYKAAKEYAPKVSKHDGENLTKLLMGIKLPPYKRDVFDCTEASSFLEWYLEGAGFHTYIACSLSIHHAWVMVELDNHEKVAIEATMLTENNYHPPGIVNCSNSYYYFPPKLYENPGQMVSFVNSIRYPGNVKYSRSEIDWWNSEPFASMKPFKNWD